jgi:hypothetical protein
VIERTAERIATSAKKLEARANELEQNQAAQSAGVGPAIEELRAEARELRACAYQLTGKSY